MSVTGDKAIKRKLRKLSKKYPEAATIALYAEGLALARASLLRVPVDTGALRQSYYVSPPKNTTKLRAEVGYGTDYALPVHERTRVHHVTGEAKYLERPFNEMRAGYYRRLAKRLKKSIERGDRWGGPDPDTPTRPKDTGK